MSLTTTCPSCKTSFKVVADQLKLRKGLVRCGICKTVFSGEEHLRRHEAPNTRAAAVESPQAEAAAPQAQENRTPAIHAPVTNPPPSAPPPTTAPLVSDTPVIDAPAPPAMSWERNDWGLGNADKLRLHQQDTLEPRLSVDLATGTEQDAVDFFAPSRRARGFSSRAAAFAALASIILALVLSLQLLIGAREWLAARIPALLPVLSALARPAGLQVMPPRELNSLTIESFELQATHADGVFVLSALLRNAAAHRVHWPAMELTLNAPSGNVIVRKVLMPADYLDAAQSSERNGIAPGAEHPVRIGLRANGVEASAYSVKLFYP